MNQRSSFVILLMILIPSVVLSQVSQDKQPPGKQLAYTAAYGSFGIDDERHLIVWNDSDTNILDHSPASIINFGKKRFRLQNATEQFVAEDVYELISDSTTYTMYVTKQPLVFLETQQGVVDDPKRPCSFRYYDRDTLITTLAGIEYRGNISLKFPKKSYDLEFWKDSISKDSRNIAFQKLRSDDDWVLDGLYDEPLRLRSFLAQKLWLEVHKPHYLKEEPKAKSGVDAMYTEVFLNNSYIGLHYISEQVDRKLLKLKKKKNDQVLGELFKASFYKGAPAYKKAPAYENAFPTWAGYEMKYPYEDYTAHWEDIHAFTDFVVNSSDAVFIKKIKNRFVLKNAIDYFLFINMVRATDNLGKNFYVARYDRSTPYFNIPWDLDGVFGTIIDGRQIETTDDILTNGLFTRLWETNPKHYRKKLKKRWTTLRANQWSTERLMGKINRHYQQFESQRIYEREALVWGTTSTKEDLVYITSWLQKRLTYLDAYFELQR